MIESWRLRQEEGCVRENPGCIGGERKGQRGYELSEIGEFILHAVELSTTQVEYEVLLSSLHLASPRQ